MTKAQIQAALDAEIAAHAGTREALAQLQAVHAAVAEQVAAEVAAHAETREALGRANARYAASPKPPVEAPGLTYTVSAAGGVLIFAGSDTIETKWQRANEARSAYALDFTGPSAHFLAHRTNQTAPEQLSDGTWRVLSPSELQVRLLAGSARTYLQEQGDLETRVKSTPVASTALQFADAVRGPGVVGDVGGMLGFVCPGTARVRVLIDADANVLGADIRFRQ